MVSSEILQYIAQNKAAGFTQEQIVTALRAAGWAEEMIAEAFSGAPTTGGAPAPNTNSEETDQNTEAELARIQNELEQAKGRFHAHADPVDQGTRGLTGWFIRRHLVKNEQQANVLMIAL